MSQELVRVKDFLAHYASEYYDPQKAHEYYMRTRDLSGRQSTKGMSEQQKEGLSYAKNQIVERQKADVKTASESRAEVIRQAQDAAQAAREQITSNLRGALQAIASKRIDEAKQISDNQKSALEKLVADHDAKSISIREAAAQQIAALPPLPKGVSSEQAAKRAQKIAQINGDAWKELVGLAAKGKSDQASILADTKSKQQALTTSIKNEQDQARADAMSFRDQIHTGLRATVEKARTDYEARKEQIKASYEATSQREYDAIRNNLPSAPAKSKKRTKSASNPH